MRSILLLILISLSCKSASVHELQMANALLVEKNSKLASFMVSLQKSYPAEDMYRSFCSGTLIGKNLILTAAHCVEGLKDSHLFVSFSTKAPDFAFSKKKYLTFEQLNKSTTSSQVESYVMHEDFRKPDLKGRITEHHDIALLLIKSRPSERYSPVKLHPAANLNPHDTGIIAGFGINTNIPYKDLTDISTLHYQGVLLQSKARMIGIDREKKEIEAEPIGPSKNPNTSPLICYGDSGGAFLTESPDRGLMQLGIVARVYTTYDATCGPYGWLTNVSEFNKWIESKVSVDYFSNPVSDHSKFEKVQVRPDIKSFFHWCEKSPTNSKERESAIAFLEQRNDHYRRGEPWNCQTAWENLRVVGKFSYQTLRHPEITSLKPFEAVMWESLTLKSPNLRSLSGLRGHPGITKLIIETTLINDLSEIETLKNLETLVLEKTQIKSLESLVPGPSLVKIDLSRNGVMKNDFCPLKDPKACIWPK